MVLASALTASAFGADAPPPPPGDAAPGQCRCPGGRDLDVAKIQERAAKTFDAADTNHDGKITQEEFDAFNPGPGHGPGWMGGHMTGGGHMMGGGAMMGGGPGTGGPMMGGPGPMHGPDGAGSDDWAKAHAEQMQALQTELFTALDTDHNGQLSQAEFAKAPEVMRQLMKKQMFTKLDTNHDGVLEKNEFPPFAAKAAALDTNSDGTISKDEVKAARGAKGATSSSKQPSGAQTQ